MSKPTTLPPIPGRHAAHTPATIYVYLFLRNDAAAARINHMRHAEWKRLGTKPESQAAQALSTAFHALNDTAAEHLLSVQARGALPFCWHGTKFIEPQQQPQPEPKAAAWPFPPSSGPTAWTSQQVQAHAAQQREALGEALL